MKWLTLLSTGIMIFLANLDITVVNLAVAEIARFLNANMLQIQWMMNSYMFATVLAFIIFGRMADHWGRRKIFLIGIFLFTLASLIAGLAENLILLTIARFIQGLGFAATLGLSIILTMDAFPDEQKGLALGITIALGGMAQAVGPVLGGVILEYFSWHWIFLMNVPLGLLSFFITLKVIPADRLVSTGIPFRTVNMSLFVISISILLYGINQPNIPILITSLISGGLLFFIFIKDCHKNPYALIDASLLKNMGYLQVVLLRFIFMIIFASVLFLTPLYLQNILNVNPLSSGLILLVMTACIAVVSPITGRLLDKMSFAPLLTANFILALISTLLLSQLNTSSFILLGISLMLLGIATGLHFPASVNGTLAEVEKTKAGTAIGLFYTVALAGAAVGVALSGSLIHKLTSYFIRNTVPEKLHPAADGTQNILNLGLTPAEISLYQPLTSQAFIDAFQIQMVILSGLLILALGLSLRLKK